MDEDQPHASVWCYYIPNGQIISIYSEGIARGTAPRYMDDSIYFFAELVN